MNTTRVEPAPKTPRRLTRWAAIAGVIGLVVVGAAGAAAYETLTTSPQAAADRFLESMEAGDAHGAWASVAPADFGGLLFNEAALKQMLKDAGTRRVWALSSGKVSQHETTAEIALVPKGGSTGGPSTLEMKSDGQHKQFLLFPLWRPAMPYETLDITFNHRPGKVIVDGIDVSSAGPRGPKASNSIDLVAFVGFHHIDLPESACFDATSATASPYGSVSITLNPNLAMKQRTSVIADYQQESSSYRAAQKAVPQTLSPAGVDPSQDSAVTDYIDALQSFESWVTQNESSLRESQQLANDFKIALGARVAAFQELNRAADQQQLSAAIIDINTSFSQLGDARFNFILSAEDPLLKCGLPIPPLVP